MTPHLLTDRAFGLIFTAVFAAVAVIGWLAFDVRLYWALAVSGAFLTLAVLAPWLLMPLNRLWGLIASRLSQVLNFVLLTAFFYLFIMPLGFILRLTGHDPLPRTADPKAMTYWTPVHRHTDETTLKDMF